MTRILYLLAAGVILFVLACSEVKSTPNDEEGDDGDGIVTVDTDQKALPDTVTDTKPDGDTIPIDGDAPVVDDNTPITDGDTPPVENDTPVDDGDGILNDEDPDEIDVEWPDTDSDTVICTANEEVACPYSGDPLTENVGLCKAGKKKCSPDGTAWSTCSGEVLPAENDPCNDLDDNDCNGTVNDGYADGATGCICTPKEETACYTGPTGTEGVGICHAGISTCNDYGNAWSSCTDEQTPVTEICGNTLNDDCVGDADDGLDEDLDGWTVCENDCCDRTTQCENPAVVNPGAVEVTGDTIDNDCNDQTDEVPTGCSTVAKFSGTTALDLVNAMDICTTALNGSWGIVGTPTLTRANGAGSIDNLQIAVSQQFGTDESNIAIFPPPPSAGVPGGTMAVLSSGRARDMNDPDATALKTYRYETSNLNSAPADFTTPHGGLPQTSATCPAGTYANDSVMLTLQLKVPTNALSFSFNFRFFSQEYWKWTCDTDGYNDFFIAMLYTGAAGIPADKNISFDQNSSYISVNSSAFFTVCEAKSGYTCPDGASALAGTGYGEKYYYDATNYDMGGGTKWLTTAAPVVPGETITLKFVIWDTNDRDRDSLVIIDNFKWSAQGTSGPSTFECWDLNQNGNCDIATEDKSGDETCNERDC